MNKEKTMTAEEFFESKWNRYATSNDPITKATAKAWFEMGKNWQAELEAIRAGGEDGRADEAPTDEEIKKMAPFYCDPDGRDMVAHRWYIIGAKEMRNLMQSKSDPTPLDGRGKEAWVSVKDRLPVDGGDVLITNENGFIGWGWYDHDNKMWFASEGASVTHWMPLPSPPSSHETK